MTPINTIKNWFTTGSKPTQSQFWSVFDSYRHKSEAIPMKDVSGLSDALANKADASSVTIKANKDASNLDDENKSAWKTALNIGELPDNIATYDYDIQDQVMMKDGTLLPSGDFGKNIANSHLQTTEQGRLTQNYNFAWAYGHNIFYLGTRATTGQPGEDNVFSYYKACLGNIDIVAGLVSNNYQSHLNISESRAVLAVDTTCIDISRNSIKLKYASNIEINALNDKSSDSTYNKLLAINSAGFVAKSDGKLVFKNVIANLNPTEALEIAQLLNGGCRFCRCNVSQFNFPTNNSKQI